MSEFTEKPTGWAPITVDGVEWRCWHVGICSYQYRSKCGRAVAWSPHFSMAWRASVGGASIGKLFRSRDGAMKAAAKALRKALQ